MLRIETPATTSNLGVGFDSLGFALNLYNVFEFDHKDHFETQGFGTIHVSDNLVLRAYKSLCKTMGITDPTPVSIRQVKHEIPMSRGLGSSASCIVSGMLAANHFNHLGLSAAEIARHAADFEGHPDNVYAALFGGLVGVLKTPDGYLHQTFPVSQTLTFGLIVPDTLSETKAMRDILPDVVPLEDAVFNLSRLIHVPEAFKKGDLEMLRELLQDRLHETFRKAYIPDYIRLKEEADKAGLILLISGSGPTMFVIGDKTHEMSHLFNTTTFRHSIVAEAEGAIVKNFE